MSSPGNHFGTAKHELGARAAELKERLLKTRGQQRQGSQGPPPSAHGDVKPAESMPNVTTMEEPPSINDGPDELSSSSAAAPFSLMADEEDIRNLISSISNDAAGAAAVDDIPPKLANNGNQGPETNQAGARHPNISGTVPNNTSSSKLPAEGERNPATKETVRTRNIDHKTSRPYDSSGQKLSYNRTSASTSFPNKPLSASAERSPKASATRPRVPTSEDNKAARPRDIEIKKASSSLQRNDDKSISQDPPINPETKPNPKLPDSNVLTEQGQPNVSLSPTLARLLEQDRDLREWLEMTGYFDVQARNRKLERTRKLAEMEAERIRIEEERRKLLEEDAMDMPFNRSTFSNSSSTPAVATPSIIAPTNTQKEISKEMPKETRPVVPAKREPETEDQAQRPTKISRVEERRPQQGPEARLSSSRPGPYRSPPPPRHVDGKYNDGAYRHSPPPRPRDLSPNRQAAHGSRHDSRQYDSYRNERDRSLNDRHPGGARDSGPRGRGGFRNVDLGSRGGEFAPLGPREPLSHGGSPRQRYLQNSTPHRPRSATERSFSLPQRPPNRPSYSKPWNWEDSRFFIVKSFNEENVYKCMEDGVWTTQVQNGEVLTTAFAKCKNVILFFSINKSKAFQGFARMSTAPSPDTPRPRWMSGIHWDTTPPFRVEWLSTTEVGFSRIGHIKNPFNENLAVLVGRDGQEIEEEAGRDLFDEMAQLAEIGRSSPDRHPEHHSSYRPEYRDRDRDRDRGGYTSRFGHENGKFIKREGSW